MKPLAIIPARGGSKRIPRKNIRSFNGKPVIAYPVQAAISSGIFEDVMVSTDDNEIADVALSLGAKVPFMRSPETSGDHATTVDVLKEVLSNFRKQDKHYTTAFCIYPVNPFVTAQKLQAAWKLFSENNYDTLFTAVKYDFPVQRSFYLREGKVKMLFPEHLNTRSQDLEPVYHDAGQFYCFNTETIFKKGTLFTENTGILEVLATESQDIDTITDWELAEIKFQRIYKA